MDEIYKLLNDIEYDYKRAVETYRSVNIKEVLVKDFLNTLLIRTQRLEMLNLDDNQTKEVNAVKNKIKKSIACIINKGSDIVK